MVIMTMKDTPSNWNSSHRSLNDNIFTHLLTHLTHSAPGTCQHVTKYVTVQCTGRGRVNMSYVYNSNWSELQEHFCQLVYSFFPCFVLQPLHNFRPDTECVNKHCRPILHAVGSANVSLKDPGRPHTDIESWETTHSLTHCCAWPPTDIKPADTGKPLNGH